MNAMKKIKVGDRLKFKKFDWVIVKILKHASGVIEYRYRVYRKYVPVRGKYYVCLSNTEQTYTIFAHRWLFMKEQLEKNPNFHYTMTLWSNRMRNTQCRR